MDERAPLIAQPAAAVETKNRIAGILVTVTAVFVVLTVSSQIAIAAQLAILEGLVCRQHYAAANVPPDGCKAEPVQSEIAFVNGWKDVLEIVPTLVLAVPYGALADKIGRRKVLLLAIVGCLLTDVTVRLICWFPDVFPLHAVWLSGLWQVIGAGGPTLTGLPLALVADICPPDERLAIFSQIRSTTLLAEFLCIPVGAWLMQLSPWVPMFVATSMTVLGFLIVFFFVPETLSVHREEETKHSFLLGDLAAALAGSTRWAVQHSRVSVVLLAFFFLSVGESSIGPLLLQYASKRLGWSLGTASYLLSLRSGLNIVVLALVIPALSHRLQHRFGLHPMARDRHIAQLSGLLLAAGAAVLFAATAWPPLVAGQVLVSLGWAFGTPARSLLISMVHRDALATVFMAASVMTYGGILTGTPFLAGAFHWGMRLGDFWAGLPYLLAAGSFCLATLAVSMSAGAEEVEEETEREVEE